MKLFLSILTGCIISALCAYYIGYKLGSHHAFLHTAQAQGISAAHFLNTLEQQGSEQTLAQFKETYEILAPAALFAHGEFIEIEESAWRYLFWNNDVAASRKALTQTSQYFKKHPYQSFYQLEIKGSEQLYDEHFIQLHQSVDRNAKKALADLGLPTGE